MSDDNYVKVSNESIKRNLDFVSKYLEDNKEAIYSMIEEAIQVAVAKAWDDFKKKQHHEEMRTRRKP